MNIIDTVTIRTQEEIVDRLRVARRRDMFGFESDEYLSFLDFDHAKEFLKPEATREQWGEPQTLNVLNDNAKEYLTFWLDKIENERGISVCRATAHYCAWKWLLGHPDADTFPGSIQGGDGGWYQRKAYAYIEQQIESGEWDELNAQSIAIRRARV